MSVHLVAVHTAYSILAYITARIELCIANSGNVDNYSGSIGSIVGLVGDLLAWNQTQ